VTARAPNATCGVVALPPFPVNASGMTFGSGANIGADDPDPELFGACGVDGAFGYIRSTDRDQPTRTRPCRRREPPRSLAEVATTSRCTRRTESP
jgi:hypothetical protein